jgi:PhnB protein
MPTYDNRTYPTVSAYLYYEDGAAALDWLVQVFGFTERTRHVADDGALRHAEIELGDSVVMLGTPPGYRRPSELAFGMHVHVEDVDAHFEAVKAEGATVQDVPEDKPYGVRMYGALDPEGNQWWFAQPLAG